ncbi:MAG: T9SS type A sorting domain-containing protein, partial [Sphingobacteriales bacterium]
IGNSARTYLLRFWAFADQNDALLTINMKSIAGDNICTYKISRRFDLAGNGWQAYEFPFKTISGPVTLEVSLNSNTTYYLDDFEIFDDTNESVDVTTQYKWWYNNPNPGWISGDNDTSVKLPDGRVAWIFSDSFMGTTDPHTNIMGSNRRIINNLVVVEKDNQFTYAIQGTPGNSGSLFSPGNGNIFWNNGAIVENNKLKVVLDEVGDKDGNTGRTWLGTLSLPDLKVEGQVRLAHGLSALMEDGEYIYIYYGESIGNFERYTKVARTLKGQLVNVPSWEYYTNDNTWSKTETNVKRLVSGAVASHVLKLGTGSYVMNAVPNLSSEIVVWFAPSPEGPWINRTVVYNTPGRESVLSYFGHIDAGSGKDGVYTFTYSSYPFNDNPLAMQLNDKGVYTIHYAKANLLKLSPFAPKSDPDSLTSISGSSVGKNMVVKWTTAIAGHDHFEIQESRDLANWTTVANVAGGNGKSFQGQFANPQPGVVFYRIKLFDNAKNLTTSRPLRITVTPDAVLSAFTATLQGNKVRLNFSTSAEAFNPGFIIARSKELTYDQSKWIAIDSVGGAGTKGTVSQYQGVDNNPATGNNYYVIAYYQKGKAGYSAVRLVNYNPIANAAETLAVYPNPTGGDINVEIANHTGKVNIALSTLYGKEVYSGQFNVAGETTKIKLNLDQKPAAGIYILNIIYKDRTESRKLIVQ